MLFKLFPVKSNKIVFLSRQEDGVPLDFKLLQDDLAAKNSDLVMINLCKRMKHGLKNIIGYSFFTLKSMYHIATAKVCVLDSYSIPISTLKHKRQLKVVQIWHALGKIKQSGYQTLDRKAGRNKKVAYAMDMHKNYDKIVAGGAGWNPYYCESFKTTEDKIVNFGLPRIDFLIKHEEENKAKVFKAYPEFKKKKVLLYAPTFRKSGADKTNELIQALDLSSHILIVKGHPNQQLQFDRSIAYECKDFSAVELLSACDYLITDYSAIAIEGAILNIKTYYYAYDYGEYALHNGLNINLYEEMPGCVFDDPKKMIEKINCGKYNYNALQNYRKKFLPLEMGKCTEKISNLILDFLKE